MLYAGSASKVWDVELVAVTVASGASSGTSSANAEVVGGKILGITATGNQDQFVDNVAVSSTGVVTVTLAANATANNTFNVAILRATWNNA